MDEESAVLGLPGNRETRLKLDADHSQMCKVGSRGPMYKLIKGNIKQIVDQVLVAEQGYIPQQSTSSHAGPPLPTVTHTNSSSPYPSAPPPTTGQRIVGTMYTAVDSDPRSIKAAEHKNVGRWDQARNLEYAIFQEHLRTLGPDHNSTIVVGYNLAEIDLELRGEGQLLGTRQHGLPVFKVARIPEDLALLELARDRAAELLARDPELVGPEHVLLQQAVGAAFGSALEPIPA